MYTLKIIVLFVFLFFTTSQAFSQAHTMSVTELEKYIRQQFTATPGNFALCFKSLDKPQDSLFINDKEVFHAASTMKTPVMIEVYKQAFAGKFSLQDSLLVKNEFKSIVDGSPYSMDIGEDSGEALYTMIGKQTTIKALVYEMITVSSNLATNILIEMAGAANVTQTMRSLGATDIQVLRGVEDNKAFARKLNNTTSAYDLMIIFEAIARGRAVNPQASAEMVEVLLKQQFKEIIPAQLPAEVKVAHKTGQITGVHHDSGIVYLPDNRKYVLILLSKNVTDAQAATTMLANVSKAIYSFVSKAH